MLLNLRTLALIQQGDVDLAFRRWRRPTVRAGGRLRTRIGVLAIDAVDQVAEGDITDADALRAGYDDRRHLFGHLAQREGALYRIALSRAGDDPRIALREDADLTDDDVVALRARLARLDRASPTGPWTAATLRLIEGHPGVRAADLAARRGDERDRFKTNVRKLKELGLTVSLDVGYRLSPRGLALLPMLDDPRPPAHRS